MISKISRQLVILHIFLCSKVIAMEEIKRLIQTNKKTIMRDLQELQNAGLLNIKFSKKEKGYIHMDDDHPSPFSRPTFSDNKARNMHLEKLMRLATIMIDLRYHTELPYYEDDCKDQETCSSWYKKRFPNLSTRTMQRDFKELYKIGYEITYDRYEKLYMVDFPEGIEELESRLHVIERNP